MSVIKGFGVEIELTLAFHQDELYTAMGEKRHMQDMRIRNRVVKSLNNEEAMELSSRRKESREGPEYRSWAIRLDEDDEDLEMWSSTYRPPSTKSLRAYWQEPLLIARNILIQCPCGDAQCPCLEARITMEQMPTDYTCWTILNDVSLASASKDQMYNVLLDRIRGRDINDWDKSGIDLVSRFFPTNPPGLVQDSLPRLKMKLHTFYKPLEAAHRHVMVSFLKQSMVASMSILLSVTIAMSYVFFNTYVYSFVSTKT